MLSRSVLSRSVDRVILIVALCAAFVSILGLRDTPWRAPITALPAVSVALPQVPRPVTLEVLVRDGEQKPVVAADVRVFWEKEKQYYGAGSSRTDADGRALLASIPEGKLWVLARREGFARASIEISATGNAARAELVLDVARRLSVRVVDQTEKPIVRATVLAHATDPLPYAVLSDADGKAALELGSPPWELRVSARGYESAAFTGVDADRVVTLVRLGTLQVSVKTETGDPAPGAQVFIVGSTLWPARVATTEDTGSVHITGLSAGVYDLKATRGTDTSDVRFGFEMAAGTDAELELVLGPGRMVTAWVAEARGSEWLSVPDADVVLVEGGISSFPSRGRSAKDGRVTLGPIGTGAATLAATALGFVPGPATAVEPNSGKATRVAVVRGGRLLGDVVDARDFPIEGASIEVVGTDFEGMPIAQTPRTARFRRTHFAWALPGPAPLMPAGELGVMPGPVPPIPVGVAPAVPPGALASDQEPTAWASKSNGSFVAWPVSPGRVRALVRHPDYVEALSEEVVLEPGGEARVRVVLRGGGSIDGRVLDHRGAPVPDARVALFGVSAVLERVAMTAVDGAFEFVAVPSVAQLEVHDPDDFGRVLVRKRVEVPEGDRVTVELRLPEPREEIEIRVADERGEPIDGVQVTVVSLDPGLPLRRTLFSDASGAVTLEGALGMQLSVEAEVSGFLSRTTTYAAAPKTIALKLERGVRVEGSVTAVRGRLPLAGASVSLAGDGYRRSVTTDEYGRFALSQVPPGPVRIEVRHADYAAHETTRAVARTEREDRAFELAPIDLEEAASVVGRVVDDQGQPVVGARVAAGMAPAYLAAGAVPAGVAITDAAGNFTLRGLSGGTRVLEAYSSGAGKGRLEVTLTPGREQEGVEIRLSEAPVAETSGGSVSVAITLGAASGADGATGVVVQHVAPSSQAERAGVHVGDVLLRVGGTQVASATARALLDGPLHSDVVLELSRGSESLRISVQRETVRR